MGVLCFLRLWICLFSILLSQGQWFYLHGLIFCILENRDILPSLPAHPPSPEPPALVTRWLTGVHLLTSLPTPGYGHNPLHLTLTPSPICPRPRPPQGQVPGTRDTLCSSDPNRMIYPASPALCPCLSCRNPNQNLASASPHLALAS